MKIKKSKFAKLLALTLPIAAISVVTPVVLTSCGSSTSNGGGDSQSYNATWDTTKTQDGLTFDTTTNSAVITLKNDSAFGGTSISKKSTFDEIKKSLDPSTTGASLFSILSGAIKDVGNYDVKLSVDTNPVKFDYTNDSVGNYFDGQFVLTPKKSGENTVNLKFRVNNFNDSYNGTNSKDLEWNVDAIKKALESKTESGDENGTGNNLPDVAPQDNGASVTINLSSQANNVKGLGHVMDELCKTTISTEELQKFITNYSNNNNYDLSNATISSWAPSVDGTSVFTRIVVPSKTSGGREAILYLAYTGLQSDDGNAVWNRNLTYPSGTNLWDTKYKEPVIDLSKVNENIGNSSISSSSSLVDITNKEKMDNVVDYMVNNYIMGSQNFTYCFNNDDTIGQGKTIVQGKFTDGVFTASSTDSGGNSKSTINAETKDSNPLNNVNAVEFKIFLMPKKDTSAEKSWLGSTPGIWRSFYIINYKNASTFSK